MNENVTKGQVLVIHDLKKLSTEEENKESRRKEKYNIYKYLF
jgi:hypothetical protein